MKRLILNVQVPKHIAILDLRMEKCTYKHSQAHLKRDKKESKRAIALLSKQSQAHLKRDEK